MSQAVHAIQPRSLQWTGLRSPTFDWMLIAGTAILAIASGLAVVADPRLGHPHRPQRARDEPDAARALRYNSRVLTLAGKPC